MRCIRVIAKKIGTVGTVGFYDKLFINYINKLTVAAKNSSGFQKTHSYWEKDYNNLTAFSISDWDSENDWNNWLNSNVRKKISLEQKEAISSEEFSVLVKSNNDNGFLL